MAEVNVKVAVRVRPLLPKEKVAGEDTCVKIHSKTNQLTLGNNRQFTFDYVFNTKCAQDEVFEKCVNDLVDGCFEGYNATVFAYGQTGSGKTYTIGGGNIPTQTEAEFGIIPRAIKHFYERIKLFPKRDVDIKVSYIEIYKEELQDLLDIEASSKDLHIREDEEGQTMIIGATEVSCENGEQVMMLLEQGSTYRHTASTQMNDTSSRSHSVFTVNVEQRWSDTEAYEDKERQDDDEDESRTEEMKHCICAKFHFVDLAGSERAHRTGNVGDRFKESVHINSGLLALGNVICALGDSKKKATHIPYRESKITRLLKDSLGGNARTLMICCISPTASNFAETLNALKYANRAKNIRNKPIVNRDPQSLRFEAMQTEIKELREELHRQRTSLLTRNNDSNDMRMAVEEAAVIKQLEDKVIKLQTECAHYRVVAEEAYQQLQDIASRDILTSSQNLRLKDWQQLMEEIKNKVPATLSNGGWEKQTIQKLEDELKQCQDVLRSDEEIFAEKAREVDSLKDRIVSMEEDNERLSAKLEAAEERLKQQEETLVGKEMSIEELQARIRELESERVPLGESSDELASQGMLSERRAKSVPVHMLGERRASNKEAVLAKRNIHTSPALISIERVMQGFRARSQLLVSRLEDSDDVMQPLFSDDDLNDPLTEDEEDVFHQQKKYTSESFTRNANQRRTYKVNRPKLRLGSDEEDGKSGGEKLAGGSSTFTKGGSQRLELSNLRTSTEFKKKQLKQSELDVRQSTQVIRDLEITIRMKEQLIKELTKSSKDANTVAKQYADKVAELEKEKQSAHADQINLQKALSDLEARKECDKVEKDKLKSEFRKKLEQAQNRIQALEKKQKETEKVANITGNNPKKIADLEAAVGKMRQVQETTQKRLKEEQERKAKLERDYAREQQKIKELELRNEQQSKVLRIKTEEVTGLQKKLRNGSISSTSDERLDDQRKWLDQEIEKVLQQREKMEQLEKELAKREEIIVKKEAMQQERNELEIKKLRSSQMLSKDMMALGSKLASNNQKLDEKSRELSKDPVKLAEEMKQLQEANDRLNQQRAALDKKLQTGAVLSEQEERRLIEIEEGMEALDAAIDYKTELIHSKEKELRQSARLDQCTNQVMSRLSTLSAVEVRTLLSKYFERVIDLREEGRRKDLHLSELQVHAEEQERLVNELRASLHRTGLELDRKLTAQQQEYEAKVQRLLQQLASAEGKSGGDKDRDKIQRLEKDLYYYKCSSRELKRKLRDLAAGAITPNGEQNGSGEPLASPHLSPRSAPPQSSRHSSSSSGVHSVGTPRTGPLEPVAPAWDRLPQLRDGASRGEPVRLSRSSLRRMSQEEVQLRRSTAESAVLQDSLEAGKNPWS